MCCTREVLQCLVTQPKRALWSVSRNVNNLLTSQSYICITAIMYASLYFATESINYKWIFILPVPACLVVMRSIRGSSCKEYNEGLSLLGVSIVALIALLSVPFSPKTYLYVEWLGHFALHPLCIGGLIGCCIEALVHIQDSQGVKN